MTCWTFTIDWMGRAHLANAERNVHHHQSAKIRKAWREAGIQGCRMAKVPKGLDRIGILFQPIYPKGPLPDPDAIHPTAKGIIDGIVTGKSKDPGYGVVPDDNGTHVAYVCFLAPIKDPTATTGIRVIITHQESS